MIRILHLSYCYKNTGAGIAAKRIHDCIKAYDDPDIKSLLRINTSVDDEQIIIDTKKLIPKFINFLKKYFERIIIKVFNYEDHVFHSISALPSLKHHEINKLNKIPNSMDAP